jgi:succinylglutamate desuccinylase
VTAEPCSTAEGERYSSTPDLGIFHAVTGIHGDILIPEDRLRAAVARSASGETELAAEVAKLLGKPWDDELEPFRYAGEGAPVRWLHQVV